MQHFSSQAIAPEVLIILYLECCVLSERRFSISVRLPLSSWQKWSHCYFLLCFGGDNYSANVHGWVHNTARTRIAKIPFLETGTLEQRGLPKSSSSFLGSGRMGSTSQECQTPLLTVRAPHWKQTLGRGTRKEHA